jgi:hypothetical protein
LPLAALLIAGDSVLPRLLGADAIEVQLRRARTAGVGHAVVYAPRVTSDLLASTDRLRREGLSVDIARSVTDVAEYVHPDETVLMLVPDLIVPPERLAALAESKEPLLLCVRDEPANDRFELIDPTARWTGLALIDGSHVRQTAAMVGDWDLASTLMRRAVQDGARRMTLTPQEAAIELLFLDNQSAAQFAGRRLVAASPIEPSGWAARWLIAPVARTVARVAGDIGMDSRWITHIGFAFCALAIASALAGWIVASLILFLSGLVCDVVGALGARVGVGAPRGEAVRFPLPAATAVIVILGMGITLTLRSGQWGCLVLALTTVGATWLAAPLNRDDQRMTSWRCDPAGHAVIGLIGFVLGAPIMVLAVIAAHAAFSLAWAMRKAPSGLARS